jgi:hypothetical protein
MNQEIVALIDECVQLQNELGLLTPILLLLDPSWRPNGTATDRVTSLNRKRFMEKWEQLGGLKRIKKEYYLQERELSQKLSDLAELLEEEGFDIEGFRSGLSQEQFVWLDSEKGTIKKHLRGVAIGSYTRR